jgi:hypothetical protein
MSTLFIKIFKVFFKVPMPFFYMHNEISAAMHSLLLLVTWACVLGTVMGNKQDTDCEKIADVLSGVWTNQLGSKVNMTASEGVLTGMYQSAVGKAEGGYPLHGGYTCKGALSFAVAWQNAMKGDSGSATAWSGRVRSDGALETTWTLTRTGVDQWASVTTNQDTFKKA